MYDSPHMATPKSDKRQQTSPLQIRMKPEVRRYLESGAEALSAQSPQPVGLGPFLVWAGKQATEKLTGKAFDAPAPKQAKAGSARRSQK
jgi:hypothetical protein